MFFYELHEGDEEVFSDVLLATETEIEPEEFFELVQSIRHRIQDTYDDDTLIEAIAVELERDHGFIFISDERLVGGGQRLDRREPRTSSPPIGPDDDDATTSGTPTTGRSSPSSTPTGTPTARTDAPPPRASRAPSATC